MLIKCADRGTHGRILLCDGQQICQGGGFDVIPMHMMLYFPHDPGNIPEAATMALGYGIGAALTLDEFALWLNLDAAAYWSRQGRESIDAVVLFGTLLAMGTWGAPLFRRIDRHI